MLEFFKRLWIGWNVAVRGIFVVQNAVLMGTAFFVGLAPVAIGMKLLGRRQLDRAPADPNATTHWIPRDSRPIDMTRASRQF